MFDLADMLEPIPGYMNSWREGDLELIRESFKIYEDKYRLEGRFDYLARLDDPPRKGRF